MAMSAHHKVFKTDESPPAQRIILPFRRFTDYEASSSVLLLFSIVVALVLVNSPIGEIYSGI